MIKCPHCGKQIQEWSSLTATVPEEVRPVIGDAMAALARDGFDFHPSRRIALGQALESFAAAYLAGSREHEAAREEQRRADD